MKIRPNKTNFSLSFGDFLGANVKRRREEEEEEEEEEEKKGMEAMFLYGYMTLSMEVFVWILVVPFLEFS